MLKLKKRYFKVSFNLISINVSSGYLIKKGHFQKKKDFFCNILFILANLVLAVHRFYGSYGHTF